CTLPPGNSQRPAIALPSGRCVKSTRPSASTSATATTRTSGSRSAPVAAIDVDVAMRQIAGPYRGAAAAEAEIDGDVNIPPRHVLRHRRFIIARHRPALGGNGDPADADGELVALRLFAGFPDGHDDATPIGVARGNRRLHQRRVADGKPDAPR